MTVLDYVAIYHPDLTMQHFADVVHVDQVGIVEAPEIAGRHLLYCDQRRVEAPDLFNRFHKDFPVLYLKIQDFIVRHTVDNMVPFIDD